MQMTFRVDESLLFETGNPFSPACKNQKTAKNHSDGKKAFGDRPETGQTIVNGRTGYCLRPTKRKRNSRRNRAGGSGKTHRAAASRGHDAMDCREQYSGGIPNFNPGRPETPSSCRGAPSRSGRSASAGVGHRCSQGISHRRSSPRHSNRSSRR